MSSRLHAATALFRFSHKKMRTHKRKREVAQQPAEHTPAPALPKQLLLVIDAPAAAARQPGDIVDAKAPTHFMQRDLRGYVSGGSAMAT